MRAHVPSQWRIRASTLWHRLLDTAFPPRERTRAVRNLTLAQLPVLPQLRQDTPIPITTLLPYRHPNTAALIHALKYDRDPVAPRLLAELLAEYLADILAEHTVFGVSRVLIVPVPLSKERQKERGYNQAQRVLAYLPGLLPEVTCHSLLIRTRHTRPQTKLSRRARLENVAGAFALANPDTDLSNTIVYLIDDVATTGATLTHAAAPLRKAGAEVVAIALARA